MWPQAVGRECNASGAKWPVGVQGEAAPERSPWAAAGRWKSPPVEAGFAGIPLLERDILVIKADSGRDV